MNEKEGLRKQGRGGKEESAPRRDGSGSGVAEGGLGCKDRRWWLVNMRLGFKFKQMLRDVMIMGVSGQSGRKVKSIGDGKVKG